MHKKQILYTALASFTSMALFAAAPHEIAVPHANRTPHDYTIIKRHVSSEGPSRPQALTTDQKQETHYSDYSYAIQGKRSNMEDTFQELQSDCMQLYGIYDGHSGQETAQKVGNELLPLIYKKIKRGIERKEALTQSFKEIDEKILATQRLSHYSDGTTAVIALVCEAMVTIANVGDSRAIVARYSAAKPELAHILLHTTDHKPDPNLPAGPDGINEYQRLMSSGQEDFLSNITANWETGPWRINGLAVSRAIGDSAYSDYGVIATPEIYEYETPKCHECTGKSRAPHDTSHEHIECHADTCNTMQNTCMILACDGVWDVIDNQKAANIVARALASGNICSEAAQKLVEAAYKSGSADNITAMVVNL